ncbi:MAG TPA: CRTAC1 family protein [Polyangia bacterium]
MSAPRAGAWAALLCAGALAAGCVPREPSLAAASDGASALVAGLEAALRRHDPLAAIDLCDPRVVERAPGMVPRPLGREGGLEAAEWRPAPRALAPGLGSLVGTFTEVREATVRLAGVSGGGGRLRARVHLRALGKVADGRVREDDGYLDLDLRRAPGGRWRIAGAWPVDLVTSLRAEPAFRDLTRAAGLDGGGQAPRGPVLPPRAPVGAAVAAEDLDGDGRIDLVVPRADGCHVLRNEPEGRFRDAGRVPCAADARGVAVADLDGDGVPDLVVAAPGGLEVWLGRGDLTFSRAAAPAVPGAETVTVFDADGDGWPDLLVTRGAAGLALLRGGRGGFVDATAASGLAGPTALGACAGDLDGDGRPDLFVAGVLASGRLFRNAGGGRFEDVTARAGVRAPALGAACVIADVDGDGRADLVVAAGADDRRWLIARGEVALPLAGGRGGAAARVLVDDALRGTTLWRGRGDLTFVAATTPRLAGAGWAAGATVFAGAGTTLLAVPCGLRAGAGRDATGRLVAALPRVLAGAAFDPGPAPAAPGPVRLFARVAERLVPAAEAAPWRMDDGQVAVAADLDGDGLLDLVLRGADGRLQLLHAEGVARGFVRVRLLGRTGAPAFGAQVEAEVDGRRVVRGLTPGARLGSGPAELHLDVGRVPRLVRLRVQWPDGTRQELLDLAVGQVLTLRQGSDAVAARALATSRIGVVAEASPEAAAPPPAPATAPAPPEAPEPAGGPVAFVPWVRGLFGARAHLTTTGGAPARLAAHAGAAATVVYFGGGADCRAHLDTLGALRARLGPVLGLVVVAADARGAACAGAVPALLAPGMPAPIRPATALYDRAGRLVLLQLGIFDPKALAQEAAPLLREAGATR